jgi:hypothetical protein
MNRKHLLAVATFVALAVAGGAAQADDITIDHATFVPTKTRTAVKAEVLKARATTLRFDSEIDLSPTLPRPQPSALQRDEVRALARGAEQRATFLAAYPA